MSGGGDRPDLSRADQIDHRSAGGSLCVHAARYADLKWLAEARIMSDVRWGILGASKFAREFMGPALTMAPGGRVAALATSDPAKADPFRVFAPGLRVHDSYEDMLADPEIDAIYIPLPNRFHVEWS